MAGYNYPHRSSSAYNSPRADDWSKTSYASDHVCRPVIVDAEGRKRPIVSFGPAQNSDFFVTRTETIVQEHVISPFASEHHHNSCSPLEGCGVVEERWHSSSSPSQDRPSKVDDFITKVQIEASRPRFGTVNPANWRQTLKPTGFPGNNGGYNSEFNDYGNKEWQKPSGNAYRSDSYDDYFNKQGGAVEPAKVTTGGWPRPSHSTLGTTPNSTFSKPTSDVNPATGFFKESAKPSTTTAPRFRYTEPAYTETIDRKEATPVEPPMITSGGWVRPSPTTWTSPPESKLSEPTSDINAAIGILKEAAKPSVHTAPNSRYTEPGFTETIDSREASKRYGKFNFASRPYTTDENYKTTIDSREAARKYHGTAV
ncbi:hypothetical protein GH714_003214 [Hevea brasiliensis]|uniref:Uncharacterized protein n=1 Tax=Hevea brasiliensis TaxID=3981 RepID=A0A6A6KJ27_HEVBR|nr:hypothetical protein GH714_003214 [Hevea brasiliensis]